METQIKCTECDEVCFYPCQKFGGLFGIYSDYKAIFDLRSKRGDDTQGIETRIKHVLSLIDELNIENSDDMKKYFSTTKTTKLPTGTVIWWECSQGHRHQYTLEC